MDERYFCLFDGLLYKIKKDEIIKICANYFNLIY